MAIYHCSIKIISRGKGKSAVAAAAYRSGEKLTNEYDGVTHDYTRKRGISHTEILLPAHAPPEFSDRSTLWNAVEKIEKAKNSQLAREIEIAIPKELSEKQQLALVREYVKQNFVSAGMCADIAIHDKKDGNPHAHILLTMRPIEQDGTWGAKSKKEYILDENGEKVKLKNGNFKTRKVDTVDWNSQDKAETWRAAWAEIANRYLEQNAVSERIDHRSFVRQGIEQLPSIHLGTAASQMERKGIATERGKINRMIQRANRILRQINQRISGLKEWLAEHFAAEDAVSSSPSLVALLSKYMDVEREKSRKYSQRWQQQHSIENLKKFSNAINVLTRRNLSTLADLDTALSAMSEQAYRLNKAIKTKQTRMKKLQGLIEHGSNYNRLKPVHDELKTLKNGLTKKRERFEQEHESDLIIWNAANRFLHANLPEGTKSINVSKWRKEYGELKAQSASEYEELKAVRAEVRELQQIRRYVDIAERAGKQERTAEQQRHTEQER